MVDYRDGNTYKTVKMGNQVWMAENLLFYDTLWQPKMNPYYELRFDKYYNTYDSYEKYVFEGLYRFDVATNYKDSDEDNYKDGICPPGWHLPTMYEFRTLKSYIYSVCDSFATCNMEKYGWNELAYWTSTPSGVSIPKEHGSKYEYDYNKAVYYIMNNNFQGADFCEKAKTYPVRCVQGSSRDSTEALEDYKETREQNIEIRRRDDSLAVERKLAEEAEQRAKDSIWLYDQNGSKNFYNKSLKYEYFTDPRDSNVYGYRKIGTYTWMTENLRRVVPPKPIQNVAVIITRQPDPHADTVRILYDGYRYSVDEKDTACPEGWHLPSRDEWKDLVAVDSEIGSYLVPGGWTNSLVGYVSKPTNRLGFTVRSSAASFWTSSDSLAVYDTIDSLTSNTTHVEEHLYFFYRFDIELFSSAELNGIHSSLDGSFYIRCVMDY